MSDNTAIEWADRTWNPLLGCERVSPGCDACYAINTATIRAGNPHPKVASAFAGLTERRNGRLDWTGRINLLPDRLNQPLSWRKPQKVFVNSQSDLFHSDVPLSFIEQVFAVMAVTPQHTYQILTKRHARMSSILRRPTFRDSVASIAPTLGSGNPDLAQDNVLSNWPLPNVWLGVSVENQEWADIRIPALLDTPAAVRWLSMEPLLGPVDLTRLAAGKRQQPDMVYDAIGGRYGVPGRWQSPLSAAITWVVVGGESGPGARPMHPQWARSLRDQCVNAGVPFFFKQYGEWAPIQHPFDYVTDDDRCQVLTIGGVLAGRPWRGWKVQAGHEQSEVVRRYGKKRSGRELDGRTWDEYPPARAEAVA